jgi:hypothetical protein
MIVMIIYSFLIMEEPKIGNQPYPDFAITIGKCIAALGLLPMPLFMIIAIYKQKGNSLWEVS